MLNLTEATHLIKPIFIESLKPFGLRDVTVKEDVDQFYDNVLRAKLEFREGAPKINGRQLLETIFHAETELRRRGDARAILIQPAYADGLPADDPYRIVVKDRSRT